jgi:hypothetical protein
MRLTVLMLALASTSVLAAGNAAVAPRTAANLQSTICNLKSPEVMTVPQMLSYQGKLTDTLGVPVADTVYDIRFRLYAQPSGGSPFWQEDQPARTESGLFSVLLGSVTAMDSVPSSGALYLGMAVGGGAELTPRLRIASAAYTYLSARAANADLLQGKDTTSFAPTGHNHDATYVNEGQAGSVSSIMVVDGTIVRADVAAGFKAPYSDTADYAVAAPAADSARVAGNSHLLQDKDTTGFVRSGQLNSVTSAMVVDGQVSSIDIRDTTVNTADLRDGAVTMAKLNQAGAASGQVIKWTGSAWAPRGDSLGVADNAWVRGTPDSVLYTIHRLGIARGEASNMLYGTFRQSHVNLGVSCTTGTSGLDNANIIVAGGFGNRARAALSSVGGGTLNVAGGLGAAVAGGAGNTAGDAATDTAAAVAGGYGNAATAIFATVGGGKYDTASNWYAFTGGGYLNTASGNAAVVVGGQYNTASASGAAVGGGVSNVASSSDATVGGGNGNEASGQTSTVAGGNSNAATANNATVGGGISNDASATSATVAGGSANDALGVRAFVGGGSSNAAGDAAIDSGAVVSGGHGNRATSAFATVGGGRNDSALSANATVGGGEANAATSAGTVVCGGQGNKAKGPFAAVGGGYGNTAAFSYATVGGGFGNVAETTHTVVGGGRNNAAMSYASTIGGGECDSATGAYAVVGGGYLNAATELYSTVAGGGVNRAEGGYGFVGGGSGNSASGAYAAVSGGNNNEATNTYSAVGGGYGNVATGLAATVPGGYFCSTSGDRSFAAGSYAKARGDASFVWSDSCGASDSVRTATSNRWVARARGGVYFYTSLDKSTGSYLSAGGSSWQSVSDSMTKENFRPVDKKALLEALARMRVRDYNLKSQDDSIRHIGPVAQDFYGSFGFGESNTAINMEDADGVALAAIQALCERVEAQHAEIEALKVELRRR